MDNITLRKAQMCMLNILKEFRRVCELLNLSYFLDSGTLLGAVRHKGFIPWDDDLDVGMLRKDYDLFLEKAPSLLSKQYFLQTWYSDDSYSLAFAKIRIKDTVYLEEGAQNATTENGFFIDIFPYDVFPDSRAKRRWQGKRYDLYRRALMVKSGYKPWIMNSRGLRLIAKQIGYIPIFCYSAFYSRKRLINKYNKMCTKFNNEESCHLFEQAGASNYGKWVIPRSCFDSFVLLPFEDDFFLAPCDYDKYLKAAYGNYMDLPPEENRINRHRIIEIRFPEGEGET